MSQEAVCLISDSSRVKELIWEIKSCYDLLKYISVIIFPDFSFALAEWYVTLEPYYRFQDKEWISFVLWRRNYYGSDLLVECVLEIKNRDGRTFKIFRGIHNFTYVNAGIRWNFQQADVTGRKNVFGPNGELMVSCKVQLKDECGAEASTQTEEPLFGVKRAVIPSTQMKGYGPSVDKLVQDFAGLLKGGEGSDVIFKVQEKEFKAHRLILATRTPVFSCMFRHQMAESTNGVVTIEDCEPDVFEDFLHYVYAGAMKDRSPDRTTCLYGLAEKYQVTELKAECVELMAEFLSAETFCGVLTIALRHRDTELINLTRAFFLLNKRKIFATVEWQEFVVQNPIQVNEFLMSVLV